MNDSGSFSSTISAADRERLRQIVRKIHLKHYPTEKLTNYEVDKLIDAWGAEVAGNVIKTAVDRGLL